MSTEDIDMPDAEKPAISDESKPNSDISTNCKRAQHSTPLPGRVAIGQTEPADTEQVQVAMEDLKLAEIKLKREAQKTTSLEDALEQVEIAKAGLQQELGKVRRSNERLHSEKMNNAREMQQLNDRINEQTAFYNSITDQLQAWKAKKVEADIEKDGWRLRAQEISEELSACKDTLFSLQPQEQISDSQMSTEWEVLCQQITRWVEDEIVLDGNLEKMLDRAKENKEYTEPLTRFWNHDKQLLAIRHPGSLEELFRLNIHCLLEQRVFHDSIYCFGLTLEQTDLLHMVEKNLARLKPARDPKAIGFWRSETLNAVLSSPDFEERQKKNASDVTHEAKRFIKPLCPGLGEDAMKRFHRQITLPAVTFATTLRRATSLYYFAFGPGPKEQSTVRPSLMTTKNKTRAVYREDVARFSLVDVESGKTLKNDQQIPQTKDGIIGEQVILVHPTLCRVVQGGHDVTLGKPLVLVRLIQPLPRRGMLANVTEKFRHV